MAAYKRDINLFKAAGGNVSKGKKMPLTKKLLIVMAIVTVAVGATIGILMYLNGKQADKLKKLQDTAEAMKYTEVYTKTALEDYKTVSTNNRTLQAIEYNDEAKNSAITFLSDGEIDAVKEYFKNGGVFEYDYYSFDYVIDEIIDVVGLAPYKLDSNVYDYASASNNLKYVYSALCYMRSNSPAFNLLYGQDGESNDLWYCYYRGQFVMLLKGGSESDVNTALSELTDGTHLVDPNRPDDGNLSPFMSVLESVSGSTSTFNLNCGFSFDVGGENYSVLCITRKNVVERIVQCIEKVTTAAKENDPLLDVEYHIVKLNYDGTGNVISFTVSMNQSELFGLEDVCQEIETSAFFAASPDFAYETEDTLGQIERDVQFVILRTPFDIMEETAMGLFQVVEEEVE